MNRQRDDRTAFKNHYDNEADNYDCNRDLRNALTSYNRNCQLQWMKTRLSNAQSIKILECGSGTGKFLIPLASDGFNVVAIDYSMEMIRVSQEKANKVGLKLDVTHASIEELPFSSNSFDTVYSIAVIRHFESSEKAINEMRRVLKDDGELIVDFLNSDYFKPYHACLRILGLNTNVKNDNFYKNYYFKPRKFKKLLEKHGFEILETKYFVQIPPRKGLGFVIPTLKALSLIVNFGAVGFVRARKIK